MARGASEQFTSEVMQRFLVLYQERPTKEAIEQLEKEFPAVMRAGKPRKYWTQVALRYGIKKTELGSFPVAPEPQPKLEQAQLPLAEFKISNPDVKIPDHIIFGGWQLSVLAIREYKDALLEDASAASIVRRLRERYPSLGQAPDTAFANFFKLRLGLTGREEIVEASEETFEQAMKLQLRKQLVMDLFAQKWREAAIVEKSAELFPDLEPIEISEIKAMVTHRRQTSKARQSKRRYVRNDPTEPASPKEPREPKVTNYSVKLIGPDLHYTAELSSREQAKNMLKALLDL